MSLVNDKEMVKSETERELHYLLEETDNFLIRKEVDASFGKQSSILSLVRLVQLHLL